MSDPLPTLWHIAVSHYSEKARWALAYKGVEHERRAPPPGGHIPVALWLTRGAEQHLPGPDHRRPQRSATRPRSSPRSRSATPSPRSTRPTPSSAAAPSRSRTSSTRSSARTSRLLAFHELRNDPERFRAVVEQTAPARWRGRSAAWRRLRPRLHQAPLRRRRRRRPRRWRGPRSSPPSTASRRSSTRRERVPGRRRVHRRRPHRGLALLPGRPPRRGADAKRRTAAAGIEELPRPAEGAPRLPLGRRDVPPPPQAGAGRVATA